MQLPKLYKAIVKNKFNITPKVTKLSLDYISPEEMVFVPGKFVNLKCPPTSKFRAYSIASDYKNTKSLELLIETGHVGIGANYVNALKVGDEVEMIGPSGMFRLHESFPNHLVFFATGTGLAPFFAMFYELRDQEYKGKINLYLGARSEDLIIDPDLIFEFQKTLPDFNVTFYLSRQTPDTFKIKTAKTGYITKEITEILDKTAHYYVCGNPGMVDEATEKLKRIGVPAESIFAEGFTHSEKV